MAKDGFLVNPENPGRNFGLEIQNIVMCARLVDRNKNPIHFDLVTLAARMARFGAKSRNAFKSVIFTIDTPDDTASAVIILYSKGDLMVMGIRAVKEFYQAVTHLIRILRIDSGLNIGSLRMEKEPKVTNVVSSGKLPTATNTEALLASYRSIVTMRKKTFTGASISLVAPNRPECKKIVCLAFDSVNFVVNGYRESVECDAAMYIFAYILWSSRTAARRKRKAISLE